MDLTGTWQREAAIWDFVHLRLGRVVSRSYAEWCGVLDILITVQLILLP